MSSQERIDHLIDPGTWRPMDETLSPVDPLEFTDMKPYVDRIKEAQSKTGEQGGAEAVRRQQQPSRQLRRRWLRSMKAHM
jgi:acetyl-CoA carboxylase beta subunit